MGVVHSDVELEMSYQALLAAAFALGGAGVMAGKLLTCHADEIAMKPHRQSVSMPSDARQRLPALAPGYGSPRQIMVLTPRPIRAKASLFPTDRKQYTVL